MALRDFIDGEEEAIEGSVAGWWYGRGKRLMVERVGRLLRTPGVYRLYTTLRDAGDLDGFATKCSEIH
jgi:hypothetical protein